MANRPTRHFSTKGPAPLSQDEQAYIRDWVFYEDDALIGFNKPSGLAVQGGSGVTRDVDRLLAAFMTRKGRKPKLVHRLDRETSGLLIVAKTSPAAAHLSAQFAGRQLQKRYLALVGGKLEREVGQIDLPLVRTKSAGLDLMRATHPGEAEAQAALTAYRVLASGPSASLVEVAPQTGRMHQIRVHFAAIGHALAGDTKYGGLLMLAGKPCPRLMLHAAALDFTHPTTGEPMHLKVPPPEDFSSCIKAVFPDGSNWQA
ncbi:RluA family pseudouridine synthase [Aquidulcibacter sp.]|uniref:RluA family pseudouridine synthase n=1 Tax=Aquidulcibacter sp. TaxID=2052990 RepID=UPI0025B8BE88|nr:RluA family pseudouridine synthase [Aquidulcibacter sp.]MCA3692826.1 RluA family pseudouridine synthase [Aquidulcibacter sp.]